MIKIFPIKSWKKYSKLNRFFIVVGFITILGFIGFILTTLFEETITEKDLEPLAKQHDIDDLKQQMLRIESELTKNLINADTLEYPGYSISFMIAIYNNEYNRKAYVFDMGNEINKERLSLYINKSNELCFRIIDSSEEVRTISVNQSTGYFTFNRLMFITCEYGEKDNKSFQRILINGKEVENYNYSSNLRLSKIIKLVGSTIGADLLGKNCSSILVKTHAIAHLTFTKKQIRGFMNTVKWYLKAGENLDLKDFGELNCDYYFRIKNDTNLEKIKIDN